MCVSLCVHVYFLHAYILCMCVCVCVCVCLCSIQSNVFPAACDVEEYPIDVPAVDTHHPKPEVRMCH